MTRQLGKTLTSIGESPDKRVQHRLITAQSRRPKHGLPVSLPRHYADDDDGVQADGKTYRIDTSLFFPHDVADETTVVDSLGQKLTLNIENIRGGGGQRRVSVYCPFWVVNTTEHALRYKQEGSKSFVSGTVRCPEANGPMKTDEPRTVRMPGLTPPAAALSQPTQTKHARKIYSGTPGGLASRQGRCDLPAEEIAELINISLPLEKLAELAFMFNFHEGLSIGSSNRRMCVQLGDGTGTTPPYQSDWSRGLSLESVGIPQMIR